MVRQDNIAPNPGAHHRRKRVGRGDASGHGSYSGKGCKGQKARSGVRVRPGFEGGQLPLIKRLPEKRGFCNIFRKEYSVVNVGQLNNFEEGAAVTPQAMLEAGLIENLRQPVKVLADGEITRKLQVTADRFSASARAKIEAAGGKIEELAHARQAD
ncbi:MAG: 50S ribosomal protein L15 [Chloroflexi bacterium]|nr:50S ribosomal protein L15 [Chloroflexota bacterium]